ncbi:MAG: HAD-IA family hydrolase [Pseudomonadota bacterium]
MTQAKRPLLVLFDCDGTLVDSQFSIIAAMNTAFQVEGLPLADPEAVRRVVGLPLADAIARLVPTKTRDEVEQLAGYYKEAFAAQRTQEELEEPLFPGIGDVVRSLHEAGVTLGVATGKSHRGLIATLERHDILPLFSTLQTADVGPGKPNPHMAYRAFDETGHNAEDSVMIGDTVFDIHMAQGAKMKSIGVSWGYHPSEDLEEAGADRLVRQADELIPAIAALFEGMFAP